MSQNTLLKGDLFINPTYNYLITQVITPKKVMSSSYFLILDWDLELKKLQEMGPKGTLFGNQDTNYLIT